MSAEREAVTQDFPDAASPDQQAPPRRRRRIVRTAIVVASLGLACLGFWGWGAAGENRYEAATSALQAQIEEESVALKASNAGLRNVTWLAERIDTVLINPAFAENSPAEAAALGEAMTNLVPLVRAARDGQPTSPGDAAVRDRAAGYRFPWQYVAEAWRLDGRARDSRRTENRLQAVEEAAASARDTLIATEQAYFTAKAASAEQTIATSPLSNRSVQVGLLRLIDYAQNPDMRDVRDGAFLTSMADAEALVHSSQTTQQAQLDDPAWVVRGEIEAYARSLSNGVPLEFVWAYEVSGRGADWLSGTAETYGTDGGWSIISLNYAVEEVWNEGSDAHAIVAHEVGHTQVYREGCWPLFSGAVFGKDDEAWATAWSISHGFDGPASGIEAYGRPSDEQIAVAGQCR